MERYALIVAGGKGERFGGDRPKQYREIEGVPLLIHTLKAFEKAFDWDGVILVLPPSSIPEWERISKEHPLSMVPKLAEGGKERYHSVRNGLMELPEHEKALVAVHDAVRPLIKAEHIRKLLNEAADHGIAVPCIPLGESIRKLERDGTNQAVDRSEYRSVQTPQCFRVSELKKAMDEPFTSDFTDEATVLEAYGSSIHLSEGDPENIKVTTPTDLRIAQSILKNR